MRKDDATHGRKDDVGSSHDAGPPPLAEVHIDFNDAVTVTDAPSRANMSCRLQGV